MRLNKIYCGYILYAVLTLWLPFVAEGKESMCEKIEFLVQDLGEKWKQGDYETIAAALENFEACNGVGPGLLLLKMSNELVCKRDLVQYEKFKSEFNKLIVTQDSGREIKMFLQEHSGLDEWAQAATNDSSYKTFIRINREVLPRVRFPEGEVAIWVQGIWEKDPHAPTNCVDHADPERKEKGSAL